MSAPAWINQLRRVRLGPFARSRGPTSSLACISRRLEISYQQTARVADQRASTTQDNITQHNSAPVWLGDRAILLLSRSISGDRKEPSEQLHDTSDELPSPGRTARSLATSKCRLSREKLSANEIISKADRYRRQNDNDDEEEAPL